MSKQMDDIVFEDRNKDYGAYVLRSKYPKNLKRAIIIAFGCFILLSVTPKIKRVFFDSAEDAPLEYYRELEVTLMQPPSSGDKPNVILKPKQSNASSASEEKEIKAANKEESEAQKKKQDDKNDQSKTNKDSISNAGSGGNKDGDQVYTNVDRSPYFIGGEDAFFEFLKTNTQYPAAEKANEDEGICALSFVVTTDGQVEKIKVVRSSGFKSFDEEAIRVIQLCNNKFKAAIKNGKPVKSICRIDITFNLD
jgi:periplasmic protein TonB